MNKLFRTEKAITLIALIITIIILVILAAVSIRAVTNMGIVNYAINGSEEYAKAGKEEERTMQNTESFIQSAIESIQDAQGEKDYSQVLYNYYTSHNCNHEDIMDNPEIEGYVATAYSDYINLDDEEYFTYVVYRKGIYRVEYTDRTANAVKAVSKMNTNNPFDIMVGCCLPGDMSDIGIQEILSDDDNSISYYLYNDTIYKVIFNSDELIGMYTVTEVTTIANPLDIIIGMHYNTVYNIHFGSDCKPLGPSSTINAIYYLYKREIYEAAYDSNGIITGVTKTNMDASVLGMHGTNLTTINGTYTDTQYNISTETTETAYSIFYSNINNQQAILKYDSNAIFIGIGML